MSAKRSWHLRLVAPHVWQTVINQAFSNLSPKERDVAYSIISALHSRHVGITPELAALAAQTLLSTFSDPQTRRVPHTAESTSEGGENLWEAALSEMRANVRHPSQLRHTATSRSRTSSGRQIGVLPYASFCYFVFRVITPLIIQACSDIEQSLLFCEDSTGCHVCSLGEYKTYANNLKERILQLVGDDSDEIMGLFWRDRAFALQDLTRRRSRALNATVPRTALPESRVFFDMQPQTGSHRDRPQQSIDLSKHVRFFDPRRTQAGTDGAKLTLRLEELNRILRSEFIYPELVRLDRLINTGFWVLKQPPQPVQTRDVLVAGICPGDVTVSLTKAFLKTCWFEFVMHLSRLLQHNGLKQSEIRWIEGDDLGRMRINALLVQDLPDILTHIDERDQHMLRHHFVKQSGWFPSLLDSSAYYKSLHTSELTNSLHDIAPSHKEKLREWFRRAWGAQREFIGWNQSLDVSYDELLAAVTSPPAFGRERLRVERFKFIHVMLFLPSCLIEDAIDESVNQKVNELYPYFVSPFHNAQSVNVTWVPDKVNEPDWRVVGRRYLGIVQSPKDQPFSSQLGAGQLIDYWLDDFAWEIQYA